MNILTAWKDSLSIFYPLSNFKQFFSAVWQELKVNTRLFFKKFWWLIALILFAWILYIFELTRGTHDYRGMGKQILLIIITPLLFIAPYWLVWHKNSSRPISLLLMYYFSFISIFVLAPMLLSSTVIIRDLADIALATVVVAPFLFIAHSLFIQHRHATWRFMVLLFDNPIAIILLIPLFLLIKKGHFLSDFFSQWPSSMITNNIFWGTMLFFIDLIAFCILNLLYTSIWRVFYETRSKQLDS